MRSGLAGAELSAVIYEIMRRDSDERRAYAYTSTQMVRQLLKDTGWTYSPQTVSKHLKAMAAQSLIERVGSSRHGYVIQLQSRKYSWHDITLLQKYFPDQFKTLLTNQNQPGGADALQSYMDRARREEARANGESYAGLSGLGICSRSGIFRGGRR